MFPAHNHYLYTLHWMHSYLPLVLGPCTKLAHVRSRTNDEHGNFLYISHKLTWFSNANIYLNPVSYNYIQNRCDYHMRKFVLFRGSVDVTCKRMHQSEHYPHLQELCFRKIWTSVFLQESPQLGTNLKLFTMRVIQSTHLSFYCINSIFYNPPHVSA